MAQNSTEKENMFSPGPIIVISIVSDLFGPCSGEDAVRADVTDKEVSIGPKVETEAPFRTPLA